MPNPAAILSSPADFWWSALTNPLSITLAALCLVLILTAAGGVRTLIQLGRSQRTGGWTRRMASLNRDTDGTATVEFALVLPILLFVILILTQSTLLMGGNLFVHYASFTATRSAIVQIPTAGRDGAANMYTDAKHETIRRSAVFALLPVAGRDGGGGSIPSAPLVQGFHRFYENTGESPPWIDNLLADRLAYAAANTEIDVLTPQVQHDGTVTFESIEDHSIESKTPITVRVQHRLNLSVPYANRIFADGTHGDGPECFMNITAQSTLTNEGVLDAMPPSPEHRIKRPMRRIP